MIGNKETNTQTNFKTLEDSSEAAEKESLSQMGSRLQKFVNDLEKALVRTNNGTYGICIDTQELIPKERLKLVPHTRRAIHAKINFGTNNL